MHMSNEDLVRDIYAAFNAGDIAAAGSRADANTEVTLVPAGATFPGRDGFLGFMGSFKSAFPDLHITPTNVVASGDFVVAECTWNGTHKGELGTPAGAIPATNKRIEGAQFVEVYEIHDGIIRRMRNYQDLASWMRQLGIG